VHPLRYLLVVVAAVAAAWVSVVALRREPPAPPQDGGVALTPTGRSALVYLDLDAEGRLALARENLGRMASDVAQRLGELKNEIALLCLDPKVVDLVAGEWRIAEASGNFYAISAFADLFALVRHPSFVEPTAFLLRSDDKVLRAKGVQAAETQLAAPLLPGLLFALEKGREENQDQTILTRALAVRTAARIGGALAAPVFQAALVDPAPEVAVAAVDAIDELELAAALPDVRAFFRRTKDVRSKIHAAVALRREPEAREHLFASLDPRDPGAAFEATSLLLKRRTPGALERFRELLPQATGDVHRAFKTALVAYGDEEARATLRAAADRPGDPGEVEALGILAQAGDVGALDILLRAAARATPHTAPVLGAGVRESGRREFAPVAAKLLEVPVKHPEQIGNCTQVAGPELLPRMVELFDAAKDDDRRRFFAILIKDVGTDAAREALLARRARWARIVDWPIRLFDLERLRRGAG